MSAILRGDSWTRRGISLLWDPNVLSTITSIDHIINIRQYLQCFKSTWPEELCSAHGYAMVVAGLDTILDIMEPEILVEWLEKVFYPSLLSFQNTYEGQCSLIFWLPDGQKRLTNHVTDGLYYWKCSGSYRDQMIALSSSLWNGAAADAKLIANSEDVSTVNDKGCIGLFHPRIS